MVLLANCCKGPFTTSLKNPVRLVANSVPVSEWNDSKRPRVPRSDVTFRFRFENNRNYFTRDRNCGDDWYVEDYDQLQFRLLEGWKVYRPHPS